MAHDAEGYSRIHIALHWIIAALVVFQLVVNDPMEDAFEERLEGALPGFGEAAGAWLHVAVGVTILLLTLVRIGVRTRRGVPPVPPQHPAPLRFVASATHYLLYGFIIAMPLVGAVAWFGGVEAAGAVHSAARWILVPLVLLHAAGALTEHFLLRTNVLRRMLVPEKR